MNLNLIKEVLSTKGYKFFEGERNINLIGIRNSDQLTNEFDDRLVVVITLNGETQVKVFEDFTTDAGFFYSKEKHLNRKGCAILKPGQYYKMWKIGKHRGKYEALVQVNNCTVYRDADKDEEIDKDVEETGLFGINMHHGYNAEEIGKHSAGCQVHSEVEQLEYILNLCKLSAEYYGEFFTYTLIEETDLNGARVKELKAQNLPLNLKGVKQ